MSDNDSQRQKEQIRVELERLATERLQLEETRRLRVAEQRRVRVLEAIMERYADLGERVTGLAALIQQSAPSEEAIRIWLKEFSERIERIENVLILILAKIRNGKRLNQAQQELDGERRESLKRQLKSHYERLGVLEEKKAAYGDLAAPSYLVTEIENVRRRIRQIEVQLGND